MIEIDEKGTDEGDFNDFFISQKYFLNSFKICNKIKTITIAEQAIYRLLELFFIEWSRSYFVFALDRNDIHIDFQRRKKNSMNVKFVELDKFGLLQV